MKISFLLLFSSLVFFSCNSGKKVNAVLNTGILPEQTFSIRTDRDTTLVTKNNCIIKIPAGSLECDQPNVKLQVKEALSNEDIVLAGLTTMSGKEMLSSAGMFNITAAEGYKVSIKKDLTVLVPTKNYISDMQVYKGEEANGKIDWVDPQPLPNDSLQMLINTGKQLFMSNCASCHKVNTDMVGSALKGITKRRPLPWIFNFIHDPQKMFASGDPYAVKLAAKWKPTQMTAFPALTKSDIYAILAYIETNAGMDQNELPKFDRAAAACADSCERYMNAFMDAQTLAHEIDALANEDFFTLEQTFPIPPQPMPVQVPEFKEPSNVSADTVPPKKYITPIEVKAKFYTVNIKTFGWVNIDMVATKYNFAEANLLVKPIGNYENDLQVMLVIPSYKVFIPGGKAEDGILYAFKESNGQIQLPFKSECYVIAFAENNGKLVFGMTAFISSLKQTVNISLSETTKEGLVSKIRSLKLDGIEAEANNSELPEKQKMLDDMSNEVEKLKPKNCNCDYLERPTVAPPSDTAKK